MPKKRITDKISHLQADERRLFTQMLDRLEHLEDIYRPHSINETDEKKLFRRMLETIVTY